MGSHWSKVSPELPEEDSPSSRSPPEGDATPPCASYPPVISFTNDGDLCSGDDGGASISGAINSGDGCGRPPSGSKYLGVSHRLFAEFSQN